MKSKEYLKLMAEWMEFSRIKKSGQFEVTGRELDFWVQHAKNADGPILEIGSGTGCHLIPLLRMGFDIVGVDTSRYMMERCRSRCDESGLRSVLHQQSMQELSLAAKFGMIFTGTGNLSLLVTDADVQSAFDRVMAHLHPGGQFIFEFEQVQPPTGKKDERQDWRGDWFVGANGAIYAHRHMYKDIPDSQNVWEGLLIIEKYIDERLVETEANHRIGRSFTIAEVTEQVENAGFEDIKVTNRLSEDPPSEDSSMVTVICRKRCYASE